MKDLNLPLFKTPDIPPRRLTGEEYLRFVELAWRSLPDEAKKRIREERLRQIPTVRFTLH